MPSKGEGFRGIKRAKMKGPQEKIYALTRYEAGPVAEVIREAAAFEGMSISSFQRKAVFEYLRKDPRFAERLAEALRSGGFRGGVGVSWALRPLFGTSRARLEASWGLSRLLRSPRSLFVDLYRIGLTFYY